MSVNKDHVFTMTAAFSMIKKAVKQISPCKSTNTDTIIFNSLNKTIAKKAEGKGK